MSDIIDSFKNLSSNPQDAEKILETDSNFNKNNFTNPEFYLKQVGSFVKQVQTEIGYKCNEYTGLPMGVSQHVGVVLPIIFMLLSIYVAIKTVLKNLKVAAIITAVVVIAYCYFTFI